MGVDSAAVLECPRCGAGLPKPSSGDPVECAFCKAVVIPQPKPSPTYVVERVIERVVVHAPAGSPSTHAAAPRPPRAPRPVTPGVLLCPRCDSRLFGANTGELIIHGCGACGGIWLDNAGSKRIVERMAPVALELAERASQRSERKVDNGESGIPCAVCGQAMKRTRVAEASVDVDICEQHGTWFDCDEMQRVMRSFDRARWQQAAQQAQEQSIDEWARRVRGTDWSESDALAILGGIGTALAAGAAAADGSRRDRR